MLTSQRKQLILERLQQKQQLIAKEFSAELGLSEDTIRRDLRELASEGLLQRVHGGALPASLAVANFATRSRLSPTSKSVLGQKAALMIEPKQVVFMDGGTTNTQLVRHLPSQLEATIVTHSPSIALELVGHGNIEVILLGGKLFKHSIVSVGAATIQAIDQIRADLYFMGVTAVHPTFGFSTGDLEESHVKRALMHNAAETVVLLSAEKLGAVSAYKIADLSDVSEVLMDVALEPNLEQALEKANVKITRVAMLDQASKMK